MPDFIVGAPIVMGLVSITVGQGGEGWSLLDLKAGLEAEATQDVACGSIAAHHIGNLCHSEIRPMLLCTLISLQTHEDIKRIP